jgi:hypothetical protein
MRHPDFLEPVMHHSRQWPGPRAGDVIVTCSSHPGDCWGLSRHPQTPQLWAPIDDALTVGADFAFAMKLDVWLRDGETCCLVERHRSRASTRIQPAARRAEDSA